MPDEFVPQAAPVPPSPYTYAPPPRRRSGWFWFAIIGGSFLVLFLVLIAIGWGVAKSFSSDSDDSASLSSDKIGVIDVDGVITSADTLNQQIRKFGDDDDVKAIILHIDSPGGGAASSQEIYNEVVRVRKEKHKKIIASDRKSVV